MSNPASLSGIKVLDLSRFIAGPHCAMLLGDLGRRLDAGKAAAGHYDGAVRQPVQVLGQQRSVLRAVQRVGELVDTRDDRGVGGPAARREQPARIGDGGRRALPPRLTEEEEARPARAGPSPLARPAGRGFRQGLAGPGGRL